MASRAETIRSIRREWKAETGTDPGETGAAVLLDQMCEAFYQKYTGAGPEYAVQDDPRTARYLAWTWQGDDGRNLRAAIAAAGI